MLIVIVIIIIQNSPLPSRLASVFNQVEEAETNTRYRIRLLILPIIGL
jgi:hypothetical protein